MTPATRTERVRETTKRQIMGALMDTTNNEAKTSSAISSSSSLKSNNMEITDDHRVSLMIEDLQKGLDRQLEAIQTDLATWKQEQLQAHHSGMMRIPKATRQMTVQEFNEKYHCTLLDLLKNVRINEASQKPPICGKRERALQTPAPSKGRLPMQTPGGTIRTVQRGELMYSANGSPVDKVDEGALVATVTKKRKGNGTAAAFDINIGEGNYISLNDPNGLQNLDDNMKTSALSQLMILQDQMASLVAQLSVKESKTSQRV